MPVLLPLRSAASRAVVLRPRGLISDPCAPDCRRHVLSNYTACHSSVMSVGAHKGKTNCAGELAALLSCVFG